MTCMLSLSSERPSPKGGETGPGWRAGRQSRAHRCPHQNPSALSGQLLAGSLEHVRTHPCRLYKSTENRIPSTKITLLPFPGVRLWQISSSSASFRKSAWVARGPEFLQHQHQAYQPLRIHPPLVLQVLAFSRLKAEHPPRPPPPPLQHAAFEDQTRPLSPLRAFACAVTPTRMPSWGPQPTHGFQEASPAPAVPAPPPPAPPSARTCLAHPRAAPGRQEEPGSAGCPCVPAPGSCAPNG